MECQHFREALSARLDGESSPVSEAVLDQHVRGCAGCDRWRDAAGRLRRSMNVRAAPPVPDLTARILARAPLRGARLRIGRIALGVAGAGQVALAVVQVFGGADGAMGHEPMLTHLTHEGAAWNLALGVGFLLSALRPAAARGQLPLVAGFVLVLAALSAADLVQGRVDSHRLLTHLLAAAGVALLYAVYRMHRHAPYPDRAVSDPPRDEPIAIVPRIHRARSRPRAVPYRRPAGRRAS